jgi:hypothetical protein
MFWLLTFATVEDLSGITGVLAGLTPAGPLLPDDSSRAEFVSGAVIALSTALLLRYLAVLFKVA